MALWLDEPAEEPGRAATAEERAELLYALGLTILVTLIALLVLGGTGALGPG